MSGRLFLFGKHPGYGDFLSHGLAPHVDSSLENWADAFMKSLADGLGHQLNDIWDTAPVLRFWIGGAILDDPLFGVWVASRDQVGRRFPFLFGVAGLVTAPPMEPTHSSEHYEVLAEHLETAPAGYGADALFEGLALSEIVGDPWQPEVSGPTIAAQRRSGNLDGLFDARAAELEASRAQTLRSHWWHPDDELRHAGWLATPGLPDGPEACWLLEERRREDGALKDAGHRDGA